MVYDWLMADRLLVLHPQPFCICYQFEELFYNLG